MAKINRNNIHEHLIEYQFNLIERTVFDALFDKEWLSNWELTQEQHDKWKKYSIATIKKVLKINKTKAEETFEWLNCSHGIKIKSNGNNQH